MIPYKEIFNKVENTLRTQSKFSQKEFDTNFGAFKHYENRVFSDADCYQTIVQTIFYSGFRASTVTEKLPIIKSYFDDYNAVIGYDQKKINEIKTDDRMIKNKRKIDACVSNAKIFKKVIEEFGSFQLYMQSFKPQSSFENVQRLKMDIINRFQFFGNVNTYHLLADLGIPVLKPDLVITRIFKRLGIIIDENDFTATIMQGKKFAEATGYPMRYIDIIFVKYGQMGREDIFGLEDGICLGTNPKCDICGIQEYCQFFKNR